MRLRYTLFFTSIYDEWRNSRCGASYLCEQVADLFRLCFMGLAMGIVDSSHGGGKAKSLIHEIFTAHCSIRAIESFHLGLTRNAIKATSNHTVTYGVKNQKVSNYITKSIPFNPPNHCRGKHTRSTQTTLSTDQLQLFKYIDHKLPNDLCSRF